jgi:hypothetical protein
MGLCQAGDEGFCLVDEAPRPDRPSGNGIKAANRFAWRRPLADLHR